MSGKFFSFGTLFLFLSAFAYAAPADPAPGCRTIRVSEVPSPQGELHAVITRLDCKDRKSQITHPWTYLYVVEPDGNLDSANPLYLFGFPEGRDSVQSIRQGVPLRLRWDRSKRLTIDYPLGTVVRYVPLGTIEMQKMFWHGVTTFTNADASLGNLRSSNTREVK